MNSVRKMTQAEASHSPQRTRELMIAEALTAIQSRPGMTLVLEGPAGTGKTFFLRTLGTAAVDADHGLVSYIRADEIESDEPYSFIGSSHLRV